MEPIEGFASLTDIHSSVSRMSLWKGYNYEQMCDTACNAICNSIGDAGGDRVVQRAKPCI